MPSNYFKQPLFSLILISISFTSCNGQTKDKKAPEVVAGQQVFTSRHSRLVKTQGTNENQNIHCSLQDKAGNLWFGTTGEGVYRYDGNVFTQFTVKDGLSNNSVLSILEDQSGTIWFGTDDGLSRYDGNSISKVSFFTPPPGGLIARKNGTGKNPVWSMMQDKSGTIWFGTSEDLFCYDGKSFVRFLDRANIINSQKLQLKFVQCILEDRNGIIWMGSGPIAMEGILRFDGESITGSQPNGDGWIRYMLEDNRGTIWFSGRNHGISRYDGKSFASFKEKPGIGSSILEDSKGNIWFTGEEKGNSIESVDGIWMFDGKIFKNFTEKDGMGKHSVWSILEDRAGNIWIGTRNCGLYRYDGLSFANFSGQTSGNLLNN